MGWNEIQPRAGSKLLAGLAPRPYLYFAHSYYAPINTATAAVCSYTADYTAVLATPESLAAAGRDAEALRLAEQLIQEVEGSDIVVIGTPMNNFTVPSVLKAWIDQILRVGRTMKSTPAGKVGMLQDRPVFVGIASGGVFAGDGANQPDFFTPYFSAALGCIGLNTVHYLRLQATAFLDETRATEVRRSLIATIEPAMASLVQSLV